jgi:hypothetical protein
VSWIKSPGGDYALVDDPDQVAVWTRVRNWTVAGEPGPADRVHISHPQVGHGNPIPFEALTGGWSDMGWAAGPPPEPVDLTRDPAPRDQSAAPPTPTKAAARGSKDKE